MGLFALVCLCISWGIFGHYLAELPNKMSEKQERQMITFVLVLIVLTVLTHTISQGVPYEK